ncbi:broad-complex core protein isoforms 1/2/3/4/5-like [Amphibalanus amphitrite]|uniref:broad-complex core protein isoforms 1/2/3/4/5-like n=1 Tax=Amphibalanus amphitrite TaxID=1232801 RepID=UPI001C906CA0|nr:broad-complex core protein isoforms 1/2/3/4/5-like [Amphibalanus amphitrite]
MFPAVVTLAAADPHAALGAAPPPGHPDPGALGTPPEFCLRWNNYHESLADAFSGFLEREDFLDVSLACDDAVISAHKCVLSACSPFFQEILLKNPCSHPTIVLPSGVQAAHVHRLVSFIYHGEVNVPHHLLPELIKTIC